MSKKITILSGFWLKIIALLTMTIDHVGWALAEFVGSDFFLVQPFRFIGRFALPLFCFMIVEGVIHTKHFGKYALRMGIMATGISFAIAAVEWLPWFDGFSVRGEGNIFLDLLLGALCVYLLRRKEVPLKILAVIPFGISVASFIATSIEWSGDAIVHWYPFFLRLQYGWYSVLLIIGFYFAYILKDWALDFNEKQTGMKKENLEGSFLDRNLANIFAIGMLITITTLFFLVSIWMENKYVYWEADLQNAAMISGAFILLYNGKRGYNAKWFEYGNYFYYPVHMLVIFGLFMLFA